MKKPWIRYMKTPIMIGVCDKQGIAKEFIAYQLFVFGRRVFRYKSLTGKQYRKGLKLSEDYDERKLKPGSKVVYSVDDFIPFEYELIV